MSVVHLIYSDILCFFFILPLFAGTKRWFARAKRWFARAKRLFLLHRNSIDSTKELGKSAFFDAYFVVAENNKAMACDSYYSLCVSISLCGEAGSFRRAYQVGRQSKKD